MINGLIQEVVAGFVLLAFGSGATYLWAKFRAATQKWNRKITMFHVIKFRQESEGHLPYYQRQNLSALAAGAEIDPQDVFDESIGVTIATSNYKHRLCELKASSIGSADCYRVMPVDKGMWNDSNFIQREQFSGFTVGAGVDDEQLGFVMTRWNGLQSGDWRYGTTAEYDGQEVTLLLDFSRIPNHEQIFEAVEARLKPVDGECERETLSRVNVGPGVYRWTKVCEHAGDLLLATFDVRPESIVDTGK